MQTPTRLSLLAASLALALAALVLASQPANATTQNLIPDVLPVVWPIDANSSALNVTFTLRTACLDTSTCATSPPNPTLTSGTNPIAYYSARSAGTVPINSGAVNMVPCGSVSGGSWWCANLTIQFSQAVNGPYVVYDVIVQWSTGVSPANTWTGVNAVVTAREVKTTSSANDADLPESRAHANATWESQTHANATWESQVHANATWCALTNPCDASGYEGASHANSTWESQAHANASWESQAHANGTWESQAHANGTWESQAHANATWCQLASPCDRTGYEGASHANSTWESQPHANATWESQSHANATWCATPCGNVSGDFVGNPWFNGTFRPHPNFGAVTATSLTVGAATASDLTISGAMTTTTALDPYVMPLVFGGMTVFSTAASLWIARKPGILGKLAIAMLLVVATIWAASATVSSDANAFRWIAVVITSGWVLIVLISMKGGR